MDYIIVTDSRLFQDVAVQDMRHHLDYSMVLRCLRGEPVKYLTGYLRQVCLSPLHPLCCVLALAPDNIFSDLKLQILKPPLHERARRTWISGIY